MIEQNIIENVSQGHHDDNGETIEHDIKSQHINDHHDSEANHDGHDHHDHDGHDDHHDDHGHNNG